MTTMTPKASTEVERTELEFREGSSDKVYIAILHKIDDGYQVEFRYGRRYNVNNSSRKPAGPVPYGSALMIYNEQVDKKLRKGYTRVD